MLSGISILGVVFNKAKREVWNLTMAGHQKVEDCGGSALCVKIMCRLALPCGQKDVVKGSQ